MSLQALGMIAVLSVTGVHDGDTFKVDLACDEPIVCSDIPIRLRGVDAPELRTKCPELAGKAKAARERLRELVSPPHRVQLSRVGRDKYFRLDAIPLSDEIDVIQRMTDEGLLRPYTGQGKKPWCEADR